MFIAWIDTDIVVPGQLVIIAIFAFVKCVDQSYPQRLTSVTRLRQLLEGTSVASITRRSALAGLAGTLVAPSLCRADWPSRPVTIVHGFAAGGGADVTARIIADPLAKRLGQAVLIESKAGAGSTLASAQVARATPDGHTLLLIGSAFSAAAAMYKQLPYRPVDDFAAISRICEFPYLLVTHAEHPIRNIGELVTAARSRREPLLYGTNGQGSTQHLLMELYARRMKINLQHVPYRGGAQALTELLGKRIDFILDPPILFLEQIHAGKLRPLATTSDTRFSGLPEVPTLAETGAPGFNVGSWFGVLGPIGLRGEVVARLNAEITAIVASPAVQERLRALGNIPASSSPHEFKTLIAHTIASWTAVIADARIERI